MRGFVVAGRYLLAHPLQPGVGEARGVRLDARELVVVAEHDRDVVDAAQVEKPVVTKALVARLDDVAQRDSVELSRQQIEEGGEKS